MQKINFKNLPDTSTPLNATNLNLMQDNIESAIDTVASDIPTVVDSLSGSSTTDAPSVHAVNEKIDSLNVYSTSEHRIGTWIDGKPLYRKVVNFGALPNSTTKTVAHNISNIDSIIFVKGMAKSTSDTYWVLPFLFEGSQSQYNIRTFVNTTNIQMLCDDDRSSYTAYITIEYTKTTD